MVESGSVQNQTPHTMLAQSSGDELARQEYVKSLKFHLASKVSPANALAFAAQGGKPEDDRHEVARLLKNNPFYNTWSAMLRTSQELMWRSVLLPIERTFDEIRDRSKKIVPAGGSLSLDPELEIPAYHRHVDIHCMPGGYHGEFAEEDFSSGAIYDRAVYLYAMGRMGPENSDIGDTLINLLRDRFPDLRPLRILDMGCSVGHSTLPYVDAFPEAEVHAIDVAAPMLRYAHARAENLGKPVHFSQQNAEHTNFEEGSFDLIVSHILVHETSHHASRKIMRECRRLLRPGGVVVHGETPPYRDLPGFDAFMLDWDTRNNNEPYWGASHEIDVPSICEESGFDPAKAFESYQLSAFDAAEAKRTRKFQGGDFGGGGQWYFWGTQA